MPAFWLPSFLNCRASKLLFVQVGRRPTAAGGAVEMLALKPTLKTAPWRPLVRGMAGRCAA